MTENIIKDSAVFMNIALQIWCGKSIEDNCDEFIKSIAGVSFIKAAAILKYEKSDFVIISSIPEYIFNASFVENLKKFANQISYDNAVFQDDEKIMLNSVFNLSNNYFLILKTQNQLNCEIINKIVIKLREDIKTYISHSKMSDKLKESKQVKKEIKTTYERFKLALEGVEDGTWDWDIKTNEVVFSEKWANMLGFNFSEIDNKLEFWSEKVHPDDYENVIRVVNDHIAGKTDTYISEHRLKTKDGSYKWILDRGKIVKDENGNPIRMVGTHQDINERKKLQIELKEVNDNLENLVAQRTQDLNNANKLLQEEVLCRKNAEVKLSEKLKDLEEAYSKLQKAQAAMVSQEKLASIGHLAAGITHEINNPLGFISSNLYMLELYNDDIHKYINNLNEYLERSSDNNLKKYMTELKAQYKIDHIMQDAVEIFEESKEGFRRVSQIIDKLLVFTRSQNKKDTADINECILSTLAVAKSELKYVAEIRKDLQDVPLFKCNIGEINQVILNLVLNASHAVQETTLSDKSKLGIINIKTYSDNQKIFVEIADNGSGIPAENINRIFDPFFTTKASGKGTGLGLNIVYDIIVNRHKGDISVNSVPGNTVFKIELPMVNGE